MVILCRTSSSNHLPSFFVQTLGPGSAPSSCEEKQTWWLLALRPKGKSRRAWLLLTLVPTVKGKSLDGSRHTLAQYLAERLVSQEGFGVCAHSLMDESSWIETGSTWQSIFSNSLANVARRALNKVHCGMETKARRYRGKLSMGAMCLGQVTPLETAGCQEPS